VQAIEQLETTSEVSQTLAATHCDVSAAQSAANRTQTFVPPASVQP
jgi:hypothetical protein